jgi:hypothetical protein
MNRRWAPILVLAGLAVGLAAGFSLGRVGSSGAARAAGVSGTPDRVIAHVDFPAAVAWAGQGKWVVEPFPVDTLNATEFRPLSPSSHGNLSSRGHRYMARCTLPLTVDEQQTFFNRFTGQLAQALDRHSQPGGGGAVGMIPNGRRRIYCHHSDFHTRDDPNQGTVGGARGSATALMVSDGESTTLFLNLMEVTPDGG